ncbi:MAG: XdhC family protein [Nitrososphaerales archaeon]
MIIMQPAYTTSEIYHKVAELLAHGKRFVLASVIRAAGSTPRGTSAKMIILEDGSSIGTIGGGCLETYVFHESKKVFEDGILRIIEADLGDDSWSGLGMACGGKVELALELVEPNPRLIILGAGHLAKAVAKAGRFVGLRIVVIDPFAKPEDFPEAEVVLSEGYIEGVSKIPIYTYDSVVICTRHQGDEEALKSVINSKARYIGMVGSANRVQLVFKELIKQGYPEKKLLRINAPIGLEIGAETPEEIAVSIIAEVIMSRRGGTGAPKKINKIEQAVVEKT